jgi:hypothetical protein
MDNYPSMSNMYPNVNVSPAMQLPIAQHPMLPNANIPPMAAAYHPYHAKPLHHMMPMYTSPINVSSYEQINVFPPVPKHHAHAHVHFTSTAIILVLYILLVIILRSVC